MLFIMVLEEKLEWKRAYGFAIFQHSYSFTVYFLLHSIASFVIVVVVFSSKQSVILKTEKSKNKQANLSE